MQNSAYCEHLSFNGATFFTAVLLPESNGRFPTVVCRSPYVSNVTNVPEGELLDAYLRQYSDWLGRGYAVVFQHCRGQGKSSGAFVPYVHEREDGLELRRWIREQAFYNGELFLYGASYTASLHYSTAPFESDVKGAVFEVQDSERYRLWYRNGQMRKGHANWHFSLYKPKCELEKKFNIGSFSELPLKGLSKRALGECADDFELMLEAESPNNPFWSTRFGGAEARDATDSADFPILLTTGYNDFYIGGMFRMWNEMDVITQSKSAMLVSPYDHGDGYDKEKGLCFACGKRKEKFGNSYIVDWFDNVRKATPLPFEKGVITYYRTFEDRWQSDFYATATNDIKLALGSGTASFTYDPTDPPAFEAEGSLQKEACLRPDVISIYTEPFDRELFVKGRISAKLKVSSSAPDTSFYINLSIKKPFGEYILRHDITSLCYQLGDYEKDSEAELDFLFDEHAFLIEKGDRLKICISSTDDNTYVAHTNEKGDYYTQTECRTALNTVYLSDSYIVLPIEIQ